MKYIGVHIDNEQKLADIPAMARAIGADAFAFCPSDPTKWRSAPIGGVQAEAFRVSCTEHGFTPQQVLPHASLLLNLCSSEPHKLHMSRTTLIDQMRRVDDLGLDRLNFHPGANTGKLPTDQAIALIAQSINRALEQTAGVTAVIENTAGQGTSLGHTFEQIAAIIDGVDDKSRVGVCIDTCHAFAAGYDMSTPDGYRQAWHAFDETIGFEYLRGMHINDSLRPAASHIDRHASIGHGTLGSDFFALLMADKRFDGIPMILETPDPGLWKIEIEWLRAHI